MQQPSGSTDPGARFATAVAELANQRTLRSLPLPALHLVMAMRLCALFERADRDPLVELSTRLGNVSAAIAILAVVRSVVRCWPESYVAGRPCCLGMSPDEQTLAAMACTAQFGDRERFSATIEGFVRSDRHDQLFDRTVRAIASIQMI
ncbi:MAG: hypothetical protein ABI673_03245 [Novosphingobium sp.]